MTRSIPTRRDSRIRRSAERQGAERQRPVRQGAVLPFIAVLLPALLMLCGFAINVAFMQLTRTELKIATDAAARAGGRAWSESQDVDVAKQYAALAASKNNVAGSVLQIRELDAENEIEFGLSIRNGEGRFDFTKAVTSEVKAGTAAANAIRVTGKRTPDSLSGVVSLLMGGVGTTTQFSPQLMSTCIQLDRDVALVLDKSGSMAYSTDDRLVFDVLEDLLDAGRITQDELEDGVMGISDSEVESWYPEVSNGNIYGREFSQNVIDWIDNEPSLLSEFTQAELDNVRSYGEGVNSYNQSGGPAPPFSRWDILGDAVEAFFDVFENSPQEERASLASFSSPSATTLDVNLVDDSNNYSEVTDVINGYTYTDELGNEVVVPGIRPYSGTGIGQGMETAIAALFGASGGAPPPNARPFAAKTIVVMTDGRQTSSYSPKADDVATAISQTYNVRIHTVTFTPQADQAAMKSVALKGGGKHYHANTADELVAIFEEIANNLPTTMIE